MGFWIFSMNFTPLRVFLTFSGLPFGSGGSPWDSRFLTLNSGILYAYPDSSRLVAWSLKTCGKHPFSAAKFRKTRMTAATSTSWGHRSVQVKQAAQSHNVSLFNTRSFRPKLCHVNQSSWSICVAEARNWAI